MAPTKRKADDKPSDNHNTTTRVTRSSTRQATQQSIKLVAEPKTKKAKVTPKKKPESKAKITEAPPPSSKAENGSKTIVIEHCKQCNQFKVRAVKVKLGLEDAVSGITVLVNPEKPRRGCFEVREEGGKTFISLLDMKRPFAPMKALDMDAVISDIVNQIQ
ncbi:hypothetical protein HanRHA438_Chr06g0260541 [Helianthus annuus]|uniref:Selenoprotein, Rdx type n=1 Tax=Helianthus annuus TaxID=4232 RepID=A0A251UGZ4_HELAN|nr:selenoprotein H [Helianthus annuus]KAF5801714.1 hypothetical protein HanXRQr2_Chr06g0251301 [Helianthus annuus]KAJ0559972.1 hypothetical protein HanHA300_Chr06g0206371 [Helianthus annuus]KAJ0566141.1 hypothetical protein HanIR_Chr06g0270471 [Helianthus annuus]KAJ0572961.1 hypothetical protein HanHA89_Chr06g0221521 [Helianthus annuus]KAJ0737403.1 hypothetical protein HanLR1_Chr06g0206621 [Helianthus annuus]